MANRLENESYVPTGLEIVLYNDQEAQNQKECPKDVITAEPLTWWKPKEVSGAVEGDDSTRKRKRGTVSELEVENDKDFSLQELYKSNNIDEIILHLQKDEATIDPQELLKNLKGWTVEKRKRTEKNGKDRVDKTYRHPKSKRILRSLVEVKKFIKESSCITKASDNGEGCSQDARSNMYLQIFQGLERTFGKSAQQTSNNSSNKGSSSCWSEQREAISASKTAWGTTLRSHDTMDLSRNSYMPFMMSTKQEYVRTFGAGPPTCDGFGASSSLTNMKALDEIKMMVQSQVEAQIEARVAVQVAEKISHYEKTQREMVERMQGMRRLLVLGGMFPSSRFPNRS